MRFPRASRLGWPLGAVLLAAACSQPAAPTTLGPRPVAPDRLPPDAAAAADFQGTWSGVWEVDSTTLSWIARGTRRQFQLRLAMTDTGLDGYLIAHGAADSELIGSVSGAVGPDHRLVLNGTTPAAGAYDRGVSFQLTLWLRAGGLHGVLRCEVQGGSARPEKTSGTLLGVIRTVDPAGTFDGTWRGRLLVQTCDLLVWDYCYGGAVGETTDIELRLSQAGDLVTGTFWPDHGAGAQPEYTYTIDVSGQVAGNTLQLTGTSPPYPTNPGVTRRLLAFSATRDRVGHLSGSLTWQDDYISRGSENPGQLLRTTRTGDLYDVVQIK